MAEITQQEVNLFLDGFKDTILQGIDIPAMAAISDAEFRQAISYYATTILPEIKAKGLDAPSVSELFGINITIKEYD